MPVLVIMSTYCEEQVDLLLTPHPPHRILRPIFSCVCRVFFIASALPLVSQLGRNGGVLESSMPTGLQTRSPAAASAASAAGVVSGVSPPSTAGDGVSPANVEGWSAHFFKSNHGTTPTGINSCNASPHFPRKSSAEHLPLPSPVPAPSPSPTAPANIESSTQPSPAGSGQNQSPVSDFADFANFSSANSAEQGLVVSNRGPADASNGALPAAVPAAGAGATGEGGGQRLSPPSVLPTMAPSAPPASSAALTAFGPAASPVVAASGATGNSPINSLGLAIAPNTSGGSPTNGLPVGRLNTSSISPSNAIGLHLPQRASPPFVPTTAAPTTAAVSPPFAPLPAGMAFGGFAPTHAPLAQAGGIGGTRAAAGEIGGAAGTDGNLGGSDAGGVRVARTLGPINATTGAGVASTAAGGPVNGVLSLAVSEDVAYIHRGSTLERYAVTGSVLVSASPAGTSTARLRVSDPKGHIATVNANAAVAERVTTGLTLPNREYLCKTATAAPAAAAAAATTPQFLPALMYRCSPAVKVLPARVTCKLRTAGSTVLVWAQLIANPQIQQPLTSVSVFVHLPFTPKRDEVSGHNRNRFALFVTAGGDGKS